MSGFSFDPAIAKMEFLVDGEQIERAIFLTNERVNIKFRVTFSALNQLRNTKEEYFTGKTTYQPFKIYIGHFTQRGMRDLVAHNFQEIEFNEDLLKKDFHTVEYDLGEFYAPFKFKDTEHPFKYDVISGILFLKFAYVHPIDALGFNTLEDKIDHLLSYSNISLKVPVVTTYG